MLVRTARMRRADSATARSPDRRQRFDVHRRAGRRKEEDERRHRALFGGVVEHVAGRGSDVLNDQTGRQARKKRLEPERRGEPVSTPHNTSSTTVISRPIDLQVQREQRAARRAERNGSGERPQRDADEIDRRQRRRVEHGANVL